MQSFVLKNHKYGAPSYKTQLPRQPGTRALCITGWGDLLARFSAKESWVQFRVISHVIRDGWSSKSKRSDMKVASSGLCCCCVSQRSWVHVSLRTPSHPVVHGFIHILHANSITVPQIGSRLFPPSSFEIHSLLVIHPFDTIIKSYWIHR